MAEELVEAEEIQTEQEANKMDVTTAEAEESTPFTEVDKLQEHGINMADIKKLKAGGVYTIQAIMMSTMAALTGIKGLSETKVQKVLEAAQKEGGFGFITGSQLAEKRKNVVRISTGSTALDELLRGGYESMGITELFGEFRTGKTQLCHTLCVTAQLPSETHGGGNGKVIYIDTEGTFRAERVREIAERFGVDPNAVLDNITYARAYTHEHQMQLLVGAAARMMEEHFSCLIVDSATALFRVDFVGRGQLADRQQKLGQFMSKCQKLSDEFNIAVVITNQVVADPGGSMFVCDTKKPIGGHIMAHASTTRLYLRKGRENQRICKIYDSPCLAESEATFALKGGGVADAD